MSRYVRKLAPLDPCPVETALAVVGGKWKARVLYFLLLEGPLRICELRRLLSGRVRQQVLSALLREMEADGLILRTGPTARGVPGAKYRLSTSGRSLGEALRAVAAWGETRIGPWQAPPATSRVGRS